MFRVCICAIGRRLVDVSEPKTEEADGETAVDGARVEE